jgi:hypothetical protein
LEPIYRRLNIRHKIAQYAFYLFLSPQQIINLLKTMTLTLTWTPDPTLLTNLVKIADQKGQTLESTLSEAVELYLENQPTEQTSIYTDSIKTSIEKAEDTSQFLLEIANSFAEGLTDEELATLPKDGAEHHNRRSYKPN